MLHKPALKIAGFLLAVSLCSAPHFASAAYTQVGFQWVTPSDASSAPIMAAPVTQAPYPGTVSGSPEIISPVIIEGHGSSLSGAANSTVAPVPSNINRSAAPIVSDERPLPIHDASGSEVISSSPGVSHSTDSTMTITPATESTPLSSSSDVVQGFAKQVPLAVALRQLLPPGYGFSIDQNIDLGTLVSFQGGQSWRITLRAALDPVGLVMREQGQMVVIARADSAAATLAGKELPVVIDSPKAPRSLSSSTGIVDSVTMPASESGSGPVVQAWSAERGDTLHKILEDWSHRAKVEFDWLSEYDYPLQASVSFSGTFEDAVRNLLFGFEGAHPQPVAELHANANMGQMVLIVTTRGNNYSN